MELTLFGYRCLLVCLAIGATSGRPRIILDDHNNYLRRRCTKVKSSLERYYSHLVKNVFRVTNPIKKK